MSTLFLNIFTLLAVTQSVDSLVHSGGDGDCDVSVVTVVMLRQCGDNGEIIVLSVW